MKKLLFFALLSSFAFLTACDKDDDHDHDDSVEYTITINNPDTEDKHVNDMIPIEVVFSEKNSGTIHHINVKVYNKADNSIEAFNGPAIAHVMESSGTYTMTHDLMLSAANNVEAHTDWIVEAKVWGHEAGSAEHTEMIEFHVHPE